MNIDQFFAAIGLISAVMLIMFSIILSKAEEKIQRTNLKCAIIFSIIIALSSCGIEFFILN